MNKSRKTLGQLLAAFTGFSASEEITGESTEKGKESTTEETTETESGEKSEGEAEKTEAPKTEAQEKSAKTQTAKTAQAAGTISLSIGDYEKLISLASDAVEAREANEALAGKAEQWDTYQAALKGGKPSSDTAGAKTKGENQEKGEDPYADLRANYGSLMTDI